MAGDSKRGGARPKWSNRQRRGTAGEEAAKLYQPRPDYPIVPTPRTPPLTSAEQSHLAHYRAFRQRIHDGPLYTVLDPKARIQKPGELSGAWKPSNQAARGRAAADPFTAMLTYSHKFQKNKRTMPELDKRDYVKSFFPVELYSLIDPTAAPQATRSKTKQTRVPHEGLLETGEDVEKLAEEEEEDMPEEEQDYDFEEDEEDEEDGPDDYNAEQYFDNGEGDGLDDEGGGGDYE